MNSKFFIFAFFSALLLFLSGCTIISDTTKELGSCMDACGKVCSAAKNANVNETFAFNSLTLTKVSSAGGASTKVYCSCPCD